MPSFYGTENSRRRFLVVEGKEYNMLLTFSDIRLGM